MRKVTSYMKEGAKAELWVSPSTAIQKDTKGFCRDSCTGAQQVNEFPVTLKVWHFQG